MNTQAFYPISGWRTIVAAKSDFAALERLISRYRPPILREMQSRANCGAAEAEELTHDFIHVWLRRDFLKNIDQNKGQFRSFIKRCIVNFLHDRHRKKIREPEPLSIDQTDEDGNVLIDPLNESAPVEMVLDTAWARQVLALALEQLKLDCVNARRGALFTRLRCFLHTDAEGDSYSTVAADLGMTEPAVRTAVCRLRRRLGEIIQSEIQENVGPDEDWREELKYFLELLGRGSLVT